MKRNIVLALLAVNLLYFGWAHWVGRERTPLTAVAAAPAKPKPPRAVAPPAPPPCATLGPFGTEFAALAAQKQLERGGWGVMQRPITAQVRDGWWVVVDNSSSNQQARTLNAIRNAGIRDAFAMPDDPQHRVSVGIFSVEDRAEDRAAKVQRLRLDATVLERMREQTEIWLDIPGVARETLGDGRLNTTGITLNQLRIETCPVAAALVSAEAPASAGAYNSAAQ
jgi:hypothetical protein